MTVGVLVGVGVSVGVRVGVSVGVGVTVGVTVGVFVSVGVTVGVRVGVAVGVIVGVGVGVGVGGNVGSGVPPPQPVLHRAIPPVKVPAVHPTHRPVAGLQSTLPPPTTSTHWVGGALHPVQVQQPSAHATPDPETTRTSTVRATNAKRPRLTG